MLNSFSCLVGHRHSSESRGISFYDHNVGFHFGAQESHSIAVSKLVTLGRGPLIFTSSRLVFMGNQAAFSLYWRQVVKIATSPGDVVVFPDLGNPNSNPYRFSGVYPELLSVCMWACWSRGI